MRIYKNAIEGDALDEDFSDISPFLDRELDFYDIDFVYRGPIFMNEVSRVFPVLGNQLQRVMKSVSCSFTC